LRCMVCIGKWSNGLVPDAKEYQDWVQIPSTRGTIRGLARIAKVRKRLVASMVEWKMLDMPLENP